jgi:chromosome segregation ATPase
VLDAALGLDTASGGDTPPPSAPAGDLVALADRVALLETSLSPTLDWDQITRKLDELAETAVNRESHRLRRRLVQLDREVASLRQELGRRQRARPQPPAVDRQVAQRIVALERKLAGLRSGGPEVARLREELGTVRSRAAASERELTQRVGELEAALEAWAGVMTRVVDLAT